MGSLSWIDLSVDLLKLLITKVRPARLERATFCFVGKRSIRLSYGRICGMTQRSVTVGLLQTLSESVNETP
jgi:hypothetical protein